MTSDQTASAPPPLSMIARTPEDVLAVVPVVLGFQPSESLVMLTFGADPPFHARVDLPDRLTEVPEVARSLVAPAVHHGVDRAFLVVYSERGQYAERVLRQVGRALEHEGVVVVDGLRADGRRWHPVPARLGVSRGGVPYDLSTHRFAAQAVLDGRVLHGSREELAAVVQAAPERVTGVVAALADLDGERPPALDEGLWARELVGGHVRGGSRPDDAEVARLLRGMLDVRVRDAAWSALERSTARGHVDFWIDVVQRCPDPLVPAPAALLAFAAWQAGDGALAWCAIDRCQDAEPGYGLAGLVAEILSRALSPTVWDGGIDWAEGMGEDGVEP